MYIDKAIRGDVRAHLALCSPEDRAEVILLCETLTSVAEGRDAALDAIGKTAEVLLRGEMTKDSDFRPVLRQRAVARCKLTETRINPKAFKAPSGKRFGVVPKDCGGDVRAVLAALPALHRFIYILDTVAAMTEKEISSAVGVSTESVRAALEARDSNLKALGLGVSFEDAISTLRAETSSDAAFDSEVEKLLMRVTEPAREREAARKKKLGITAAIAGCAAIVLAVVIVLVIKLTENTDTTSGNGTGGGSSADDIFDEVTVDLSKKYYADIAIRNFGTIVVELDHGEAPITVSNFVRLAESGFYDGLTFHRIIEGFMMQGGDPQGNGYGGSDQKIKGEFRENGVSNDISHVAGVISMARSASYNSASSQFFIVHEDSTDSLDGKYAAFGRVISGMEIVDAICRSAEPIDGNGGIARDDQPVIDSIKITTK